MYGFQYHQGSERSSGEEQGRCTTFASLYTCLISIHVLHPPIAYLSIFIFPYLSNACSDCWSFGSFYPQTFFCFCFQAYRDSDVSSTENQHTHRDDEESPLSVPLVCNWIGFIFAIWCFFCRGINTTLYDTMQSHLVLWIAVWKKNKLGCLFMYGDKRNLDEMGFYTVWGFIAAFVITGGRFFSIVIVFIFFCNVNGVISKHQTQQISLLRSLLWDFTHLKMTRNKKKHPPSVCLHRPLPLRRICVHFIWKPRPMHILFDCYLISFYDQMSFRWLKFIGFNFTLQMCRLFFVMQQMIW